MELRAPPLPPSTPATSRRVQGETLIPPASELGGNNFNGFTDFRPENGSRHGQNLALTVCVPRSSDRGWRGCEHPPGHRRHRRCRLQGSFWEINFSFRFWRRKFPHHLVLLVKLGRLLSNFHEGRSASSEIVNTVVVRSKVRLQPRPLPSEEERTETILNTFASSHRQNLAVTVLCVPSSFNSGWQGCKRIICDCRYCHRRLLGKPTQRTLKTLLE